MKVLSRQTFWFAGIVAGYLLVTFITFNQMEEDAYIYFRIAANLANGDGFFVFNRGGQVIESGSSLLWQVILAPVYWLFPSMVVATKLLGVLLACVALWLVYRLARQLTDNEWLQLFPVAALAVSVPFYMWMQRALETPLYVLLLLVYALILTSPRLLRFWFVPAFLVFCARPEGFLYIGAAGALLFTAESRRALFRGLPVLAVLCACVVVFRFFYFGDLVQHPFYIKLRSSSDLGLSALWSYLRVSYLWLLLVPCLPFLFQRQAWNRVTFVCGWFAVIALYWAISGEDWKPYNRHLLPALPFIFLLCTRSADQALQHFRKASLPATVFLVVFLALTLLGSRAVQRYSIIVPNPVLIALVEARRVELPAAKYFAGFVEPELHSGLRIQESYLRDPIAYNWYTPIAEFITRNYADDSRILYDQMGQVPWQTGLSRVYIDSAGLLDRPIGFYRFQGRAGESSTLSLYLQLVQWLNDRFWHGTSRDWSQAEILDYIYATDPDVVVLSSLRADKEGSMPWLIEGDARLLERYRPAWYVSGARIYERRDLPVLTDPVPPQGYETVPPLTPDLLPGGGS